MKFVQTIEFKTSRIDEVNARLDEYLAASQGTAIPTRGVMTRDRDGENTYVQIVEFPSYEQAMENSNRPETAELSEAMMKLCDGPPIFRNLDVLREETM